MSDIKFTGLFSLKAAEAREKAARAEALREHEVRVAQYRTKLIEEQRRTREAECRRFSAELACRQIEKARHHDEAARLEAIRVLELERWRRSRAGGTRHVRARSQTSGIADGADEVPT